MISISNFCHSKHLCTMRIEVHARPSLYRSGIACGWCPCCGVALWSHRSGGRSTGYSGSRGISPLFEATFPRRDEGKTKQTWTWLTRGQVMVSRFNSIFFCCLSLLKKIGRLKDLKKFSWLTNILFSHNHGTGKTYPKWKETHIWCIHFPLPWLREDTGGRASEVSSCGTLTLQPREWKAGVSHCHLTGTLWYIISLLAPSANENLRIALVDK